MVHDATDEHRELLGLAVELVVALSSLQRQLDGLGRSDEPRFEIAALLQSADGEAHEICESLRFEFPRGMTETNEQLERAIKKALKSARKAQKRLTGTIHMIQDRLRSIGFGETDEVKLVEEKALALGNALRRLKKA